MVTIDQLTTGAEIRTVCGRFVKILLVSEVETEFTIDCGIAVKAPTDTFLDVINFLYGSVIKA